MKNKKQLAIMLGILTMHQSMQGAMISGARQLGQGLGSSAARTSMKAAPTALTGMTTGTNAMVTPNFTPTQPAPTASTYPISYARPQRLSRSAGQSRSFSTTNDDWATRLTILENLLRPISESDINTPLINLLLQGYNANDFLNIVQSAKNNSGDHLLNTNDIRQIILEIENGPINLHKNKSQDSIDISTAFEEKIIYYPKGTLHSTAIHEASHTIAEIFGENPSFVETLTIEPRAEMAFMQYRDSYLDIPQESKINTSKIITCLAGAVGEQIFDTYQYQDYSHKMLTDTNEIFDFLSTRIGAKSDLQKAITTAENIILSKNMTGDQGTIIKEIIADCYKKAYQLINSNKDNVQKLVDAAMKKGTLHEDEIYQILDIPRPLHHFEQGPVPQAEMAKVEKYRFPVPEDFADLAPSMPTPEIDSEKYYDNKKVALNKIEIRGETPTAARSIYAMPATAIKAPTAPTTKSETQLPPDLHDYSYDFYGKHVGPKHGTHNAKGQLFEL
jgi:Peptidase family M41